MENQVDSKQIIIKHGLMLGAVSILSSLVLYSMGQHLKPNWIYTLITSLAFIGLIVYGVKKFKDDNNGFLSFGEAIKVGVGIAIVSALLAGLYQYIFMNFIEPDFMSQMMDLQYEQYVDAGMSDEEIEASQKIGEKFSGPVMMVAFGIIGSAIGGFIVSAIAGAIMKKSEEEEY